jgi:thioesterase domain-containing protein
MSQIQQQFGKNLPLATLFQSSTVEQQAYLISQNNDCLPWSPLVAIQPKGTKQPIFCVPGIGGNVIYFYDFACHLGSDQPFYALQALGLDGESQPHKHIEDMAACYIEAIQTVQPQGPYILAGHSFGSWVVFEMAKQLKEKGHEIALLAVIDFWAPIKNNKSYGVNWNDAKLLTKIAKQIKHLSGTNLEVFYEDLVNLEQEEKLNYLKNQLQKVNLLPPKMGILPIKGMLQVYKMCVEVSYFSEKVNPTSITIFRAIEGFPDWAEIAEPSEVKQNPSWGWENFSLGSVDIHWVPGDHYTLLSKPHVQVLAEKLKACLDKLPD